MDNSTADIHFPTDVWLLDTARSTLEHIIDFLYAQVKDKDIAKYLNLDERIAVYKNIK